MNSINWESDIFCFGFNEESIPWNELEKRNKDIRKNYQRKLEEYSTYHNKTSVGFLVIQIEHGWHGKYLLVVMPDDTMYNGKLTALYMTKLFRSISQFANNIGYKHQVQIDVYQDTIQTWLPDTLQPVIEQINKTRKNTQFNIQ